MVLSLILGVVIMCRAFSINESFANLKVVSQSFQTFNFKLLQTTTALVSLINLKSNSWHQVEKLLMSQDFLRNSLNIPPRHWKAHIWAFYSTSQTLYFSFKSSSVVLMDFLSNFLAPTISKRGSFWPLLFQKRIYWKCIFWKSLLWNCFLSFSTKRGLLLHFSTVNNLVAG